MVQNNVTNHLEKWLGPSDATMGIIRQNDGTESNPYRDVSRSDRFGVRICASPPR
jgi:hypothetical protein